MQKSQSVVHNHPARVRIIYRKKRWGNGFPVDFIFGGIPQGENSTVTIHLIGRWKWIMWPKCKMLPCSEEIWYRKKNHKNRLVNCYCFALAEFLQEGNIKRKENNPIQYKNTNETQKRYQFYLAVATRSTTITTLKSSHEGISIKINLAELFN